MLYQEIVLLIAIDRHGGYTSSWLCLVLLLGQLSLTSGCQELGPADGIFLSDVEEVVIEVDYLAGAVPCDGWIGNRGRVWDLFLNNLQILFAPAPRELTIQRSPTPIAQIKERFDFPSGRAYSESEILEIVSAHRQEGSTHRRRAFYVIFLDGYYKEGGEVRNVRGRTLRGNSGAIAMFKPALRARGWFGEQSTLVHEFGHAVGLVNRGLEMVQPHQDSEHGSHCEDPSCIMYHHPVRYSSYQTQLPTADQPLFCSNCLQDAHAASDGQLAVAY